MAIIQNPVDLKSFYRSIMQKDPLLYNHQFTITFSGKDIPSFVQNGTGYESIMERLLPFQLLLLNNRKFHFYHKNLLFQSKLLILIHGKLQL